MAKSVSCTRRSRAAASHSHTARTGDKPAPSVSTDGRHLLDRILNTPGLEQVVPRLQPDLLHRIIQSCGLEDCGELIHLATPEQLMRIFDLDLWRAGRPGMDEQFDPDRFGVWIEVLVESGAETAAQKLAGIDVELIVAGLAQHVLVYDRAAVEPYQTLDGEWIDVYCVDDDELTFDMGGYLLVARRTDSWEAIIEVLLALGAGHSGYFQQVMAGCRSLSNSGRELDGLDDLLADEDQAMFDLAVDREGRREKQGYVTPPQARAFLRMARELRLGSDAPPPANPLARAYFRDLNERLGATVHRASEPPASVSEGMLAPEAIAESVAAVFELLREAGVAEGVVAQAPRALLAGSEGQTARLARIQTHMQFVLDHDQAAYSTRNEELAYLANTLMAGCAIQSRPFTAKEASDAAVAICNLGLENWPPHWLPANATSLPGSFPVDHATSQPGAFPVDRGTSLPISFLVDQDLISVFQVGWAVLHNDVSMYAAEQLIEVLTRLRYDDPEIQTWLDSLRIELGKHWRAGAPWRARDALDAIAILDMPAWSVLLGLIDECPVLHPVVSTSGDARTLSVTPSDFDFISENSQIALVREFIQSLPEHLRG